MKKTHVSIVFISIISLFVFSMLINEGCGGGISSGKVIVDINGKKITEGDLNFLGEINPRIKSQLSNPMGRKRILDNLVEQEMFYQEAVKEGLNRSSKVKAKIDLYRKVIIAQALLQNSIKKAAKKYYDEHADEFKKLRMSHIMIKYASKNELKHSRGKARRRLHSEADALKIAKQIRKQIDEGESFSKAAMDKSDDFITKTRGGDLGLVSKNDSRLIRRGFGPLLDKAFSMKVGEVAGPIKTAKGYHLITVTRGIEVEPFAQAERSITFKVRNDTRNDLLARLKKELNVVYPEKEKKINKEKKIKDQKPTTSKHLIKSLPTNKKLHDKTIKPSHMIKKIGKVNPSVKVKKVIKK